MRSLIQALRPRQWVKNLLVFAVPLAAARIFEPQVLLDTLIAFAVFCAASSSVYLVNDLLDRESDRLHPTKRFRAIASGRLSPGAAWTTAALLACASIAVPFAIHRPGFASIIIAYLALQLLYVFWAKHHEIVDVLSIAAGFCLRGVAGAAATGIAVTEWFMLVIAAGSLFVVAGKRFSELLSAKRNPDAHTRSTLLLYSESFLRFVWTLAGSALVLGYALWAFQIKSMNPTFTVLSAVPFLAIVLYYAADIDAGRAEGPEEVVFRDRRVQVAGLLWLVLFVLATAVPADPAGVFSLQ
ncbi:phosphoribose diphosphate:decaprenyl-phosphate phosphoribosyltransferase [Leucobacter sp. UCD-THU]|jgi:decaprenyl-phosphate phosphoribosyltransferase|nr:phosphoribose diphosphate:decaprenyl-phosphate phosphoribosyltransferase [Leucobacter sp. UCD-THU]